MRAEIVSVGAELTTGAVLDTNSAWLSDRLTGLGVVVTRHVTVGDDLSAIVRAVRRATEVNDVVLVTGGLGPTLDDLTRQALAEVTGQPLEIDPRSQAAVEAFFASIGRTMAPGNRRQAMLPHGATALANEWGTAPGIRAEVGRAVVYAFPGVPREMRGMFGRYAEPDLRRRSSASAIVVRTLRTYGAGESNVAEQIGDLMSPGRNPAVGTTASEGIITVRIVAWAEAVDEATAMADRDAQEVRTRLGPLVYGEDDQTLAAVVGGELTRRSLTVATAESCTGGLLGKLLTDVPGSSAYYLGGFVAYSNEVKTNALGVPPDLIETQGAVSEEVARALAAGCRDRTHSDYALSVTGIAGPTRGTPEKPVGLVYLGLAGPNGSHVKRCQFSDRLDREAIRDRSAKTALNMLRRDLMEPVA